MSESKRPSAASKAAKPNDAAARTPPAKRAVAVNDDPANAEFVERVAKAVLRPSVNAAAVVFAYAKPVGGSSFGGAVGPGYGALMDALIDDEGAWSGDMKRAEHMLYAQAHALQSIFMNLSLRATKQEYMKHWEAYLRMAMKAQNQCRMTLETLATIKNPPAVFARQVNVAHQQLVNNGAGSTVTSTRTGAHAANHATEQTELLEASNGQRLDTSAAGAASGTDSPMEAVGAIHRPAQR